MAPHVPNSAMRRDRTDQRKDRKAAMSEEMRRARAEEKEERKAMHAERLRRARVDSRSGHSLGDEAMRVSPTSSEAFVSLLHGDTDDFSCMR